MAERNGVDLWALSDLCTPWCTHVVATLRIADHVAVGASAISAPRPGADAVLVLVDGKERSLGEFCALACAAGLDVIAGRQLSDRFVVECRPAGSINP
jgi:hypothetical protein